MKISTKQPLFYDIILFFLKKKGFKKNTANHLASFQFQGAVSIDVTHGHHGVLATNHQIDGVWSDTHQPIVHLNFLLTVQLEEEGNSANFFCLSKVLLSASAYAQ